MNTFHPPEYGPLPTYMAHMVTSAHEGMHRIFQERPEILSPVFGVLGIAFPEKAAVYAIGTDVTEARPLARHIDTVLRIGPSDGEDFLLAPSGRPAPSPVERVVGSSR
ncbi:hypothetical protein ABT116_38085 [Streptomyces sp. NPDC002130]|uniref:hypothetical protein n=1 Tax=Streptomyces sp. NPDC002130 TaxID=3155568 RepID=UPI0033346A11